jgi:hypothetical protein
MGYIRRKIKTRRRVKRTKTNTRKRKQNRTFRKSRRVNRGGADKRSRRTMEDTWQTDTRTEKEKSEQDAIENEKDTKNELKRVANKSSGLYLEPGSEGDDVNQEEQLETTDRQTGLMDDIDAETDADADIEERPGKNRRLLEGGPLTFGGKKKRGISKK